MNASTHLAAAALIVVTATLSTAQDRDKPDAGASPPTIAERTKGFQKIDGFLPLYWQPSSGRLLMEIGWFNHEMLYQVSLPAGLGSNPVGLDRGQLGDSAVVFFDRVGQKILLTEPNYRYRALTANAAERRAVDESFARSVLWGFKVDAEEGGRVLVDATAFFLRDAHGVTDRLRATEQGRYRLDESRSALYMDRTKGFPRNTEVEASLTFTTEEVPGPLVRQTTPNPAAITLREHHSFIELPDAGYTPRRLDPRAPSFGVEFYDYASPVSEPIEKRWISRHRLQKKDPAAAISDPVAPLVYYVDNGAPEAIRAALIDGASWWSQAFEAAGFRNAFQVRVLPADADPMDVRYNMISWVHRSTRGWSYGGGITDPRTGEIIKGNVTLGSLRVRQDYLIGIGLTPAYASGADGDGACLLGLSPEADYLVPQDVPADVTAMALARIRQLAAHEVGHTLGFAHNFAASSYGRASVMDYPAPWVDIKGGRLDLSNAYATGIGTFDKFAARFAYSQFAPGVDQAQALEAILRDGVANGMLFISDADARPPGSAHPLASLWDNGSDPVATLKHEMEVRRIGLSTFGLRNIPVGTPLSELERQLVPLFLHHRYQLQAAAKSVGGIYFTYAVRTPEGPHPARVAELVPADQQRAALAAILSTLSHHELRVSERVLDLLPPPAFGYGGGTAEPFTRRGDSTFDPVAAAGIAADLAVSALLQPVRAARLVAQQARGTRAPGLAEVVMGLIAATWRSRTAPDSYGRALQHEVQNLVVTRLKDLASNADASPAVRAEAAAGLRQILGVARLAGSAHAAGARDDIERFLKRPEPAEKRTPPLTPPAGEPIGGRAH